MLVDILCGPDRQRQRYERHETVQPNPKQHGKRPQGIQIVVSFAGRVVGEAILHSVVPQWRERKVVRRPE